MQADIKKTSIHSKPFCQVFRFSYLVKQILLTRVPLSGPSLRPFSLVQHLIDAVCSSPAPQINPHCLVQFTSHRPMAAGFRILRGLSIQNAMRMFYVTQTVTWTPRKSTTALSKERGEGPSAGIQWPKISEKEDFDFFFHPSNQ